MTTKTFPTLEGQTILIIGGTSGIGFGVAVVSLREGASKIILASSSPERVKEAVEKLKGKVASRNGSMKGEEVEIKGVVLDVKDLKALDRSVKDVGTINHLVVTSGDGYDATFAMDVNKFDIGILKGEFSTHSTFCREISYLRRL
jgi:NAD(P)-dependent dehydrogenase (short-subunit alcohol dehydrogenase family)